MDSNLNYRPNDGVIYMAVGQKRSMSLECEGF